MDEKIKLLTSQLGQIRVKYDIDLSGETKNHFHAQAQSFYIATTARELIVAVQLCKDLRIPYIILGSGSKIVLDKKYIEGLVIKNRSDSLKLFGIRGRISKDGLGIEEALLEADSGVSLKRLSEYAKLQKLGGFSELYLDSGTVGGSILSNQTLRDKANQIKVFCEYENQEIKPLADLSATDVIISVTFKLKAQK